ncbi:Slp family lipoprotein [Xenorhabdus indica]|uniref:Slp family lipoprotein n=1 Tax=Xenorhabdus indica TaxID=333964 RepID=UPI00165741C9|nr:Slp family lipoprotein [Xenorhabdus indica]MBC8945071.1 membrane protein [Xenorhabdus indica]
MLNGTHYRLILQLIAFIGAMILTGCVSVPDSIKGTTKNPIENLLDVKKTPDSYIGHEGRFGGKVLSVLNEKGRTRLEISTLPLASDAAPLIDNPSLGRLYAYVNSFLEPSDFQDHYVTVVGLITGLEKGKVGDSPYDYVLMNVNGFKLWNEVQRISLAPSTGNIWGYYGNPYFMGWGGSTPILPSHMKDFD